MAKPELTLTDMLAEFSENIQSISSDNYVPHDAQIIFHKSEAKEKIFIGGNRSGKTYGSVLDAIWRVTKTHPFRPELNAIVEPIRGRHVAVSIEEGLNQIVLPLYEKYMPKRFLVNNSWDDSYHKQSRKLILKDGSFIEFMTYEQATEKFAGTSRHFVAFDEEPRLDIWHECIMRLLDTDGDWWIAMTPVEGVTWTFTEIVQPYSEGKRPYALVLWVNTLDNPHIKKEAYDRTMANFNEEDRLARSEGNYNFDRGLIYKEFNKDENIYRGEFTIPHSENSSWLIYTSLDSGWKHPAAWLWHAVHESGRIITFHEICLSEITVHDLAAKVRDYEATNNITVHFRTGDPALLQTREQSGTSVLDEYGIEGIYINVAGVLRGPGSIDAGINRVSTYLKARVKFYDINNAVQEVPMYQVHESCTGLIKEFENYRWAKHSSRKIEYIKAPKKEPEKKNDDRLDSLRYFVTTMQDLSPDKMELLAREIYYFQGKRVTPYSWEEDDLAHPNEDYQANIYEDNGSWY